MSSGQFNLPEILQTNADLQQQIDTIAIPGLPDKINEGKKSLIYTLADSGWLTSTLSGNYFTKEKGKIIPKILSINYNTDINIPPYFLPFIKIEIEIQPPPNNSKVTGLWAGILYTTDTWIEIDNIIKGLAINFSAEPFSDIKTIGPYAFYLISDESNKWDYIVNKKIVYGLTLDYNYNGDRYRVVDAPITGISPIPNNWPIDPSKSEVCIQGQLYFSFVWGDPINAEYLFDGQGAPGLLDVAGLLNNISIDRDNVTFTGVQMNLSGGTTPYYDIFSTGGTNTVEFNKTFVVPVLDCIFGFDNSWGIVHQKFINNKWETLSETLPDPNNGPYSGGGSPGLFFWDNINGKYSNVFINSASVSPIGYAPCWSLDNLSAPPWSYVYDYTLNNSSFFFQELSASIPWTYGGITSHNATTIPIIVEQVIPGIDTIPDRTIQVFSGNDKNTNIILYPNSTSNTTIQKYNINVNNQVVLTSPATVTSSGTFAQLFFDGITTTSSDVADNLFTALDLDCLYRIKVNLVMPFYYNTQQRIDTTNV